MLATVAIRTFPLASKVVVGVLRAARMLPTDTHVKGVPSVAVGTSVGMAVGWSAMGMGRLVGNGVVVGVADFGAEPPKATGTIFVGGTGVVNGVLVGLTAAAWTPSPP